MIDYIVINAYNTIVYTMCNIQVVFYSFIWLSWSLYL